MVELTFTALPEHVRTARLVASAVARRLGVEEDVLDAIRLAVGEACGRAVSRCAEAGVSEPVTVEISEGSRALVVRVRDYAPTGSGLDAERLSTALVQGLAQEVEIEDVEDGDGSVLRLTWRL
jgi:anti-sigma regulatory factor (Ser/Thr protein kinase)